MVNYFLFSVKNLRKRGIRSWLTLLGIVIGIVAVVTLFMLADGLKLAVSSQFGVSSTQVITIQAGGLNNYGPPGSGVTNPLTKQDAETISKISEVKIAIARVIKTVSIEYKSVGEIGYAASLDEKNLKESYILQELEVAQGRLLKESDSKKVLVGTNYGDKDKSPLKVALVPGKNIKINNETFEVAGIIEKKGSFILDGVIFILDKDFEPISNYGDNVSLIVAEIKSKDLINKAKESIEKVLRERRNVKIGEEDFTVQTPQAALSTVNSILTGIQIFVIIIASISIFVGAVGIVNTMTTSVLERKKQIGIMKAIGAKNSQIFFLFFVESGLLGTFGGLIGLVLGSLLGFAGISGLNSFLGTEIKMQINWMFCLAILFGSFLIGAFSGIAPAMQASRHNPVEALRG